MQQMKSYSHRSHKGALKKPFSHEGFTFLEFELGLTQPQNLAHKVNIVQPL